MFLASTPVGGAPMAGARQQPFNGAAQTALLNTTGQSGVAIGREVTGLSVVRQSVAVRLKDPVWVPNGAPMSAVSSMSSNTEVQP